MKTFCTHNQVELVMMAPHPEDISTRAMEVVTDTTMMMGLVVVDHTVVVVVGPVLEAGDMAAEEERVAEAVGAMPDLPKVIDR
jgi:hypothetical protein